MDNPCPTLTTEERTLGGLSYLLGALVALAIFLVEKGKSRYAPFQAPQAIILSVFWMLVFSLLGGLFLLLFFLGGFATLISAAAIMPTQSGPTNVLQLVPMLLPFASTVPDLPAGTAGSRDKHLGLYCKPTGQRFPPAPYRRDG